MADIEKVMSVEDADIEKFMGVDRADIEKIMGVEMPSLVNAWQGDRGVFGGGYTGSAYVNVIDYISIASLNNADDFGAEEFIDGEGEAEGEEEEATV